jgi:thymidylate kinase
MIVEFIGCSGAGKTTLAHAVRARAAPDRPARMALDLVMDRPGRRWIRQPQLVNLAADVAVSPSFLTGGQGALLRFADDRLRRYAPSAFARLNYLVNVERRVGTQLLARRRANGATILSDEGALLLAYQLFVYAEGPYGRADLERFVELVPMPDRVVYVRAPFDVLVDRSMARPDRRRELAAADRVQVERWTLRAHALFEALIAVPAVAERLLVVDNGDLTTEERTAVADGIGAFIHEPVAAGAR